MTVKKPWPHKAIKAALLPAARAYCRARFVYEPHSYRDGEQGAIAHIEYDATSTITEGAHRATVEAAVMAALPIIEKHTLLEAAAAFNADPFPDIPDSIKRIYVGALREMAAKL